MPIFKSVKKRELITLVKFTIRIIIDSLKKFQKLIKFYRKRTTKKMMKKKNKPKLSNLINRSEILPHWKKFQDKGTTSQFQIYLGNKI